MDVFTVIVMVGMLGGFLWILALGLFSTRSGADVLDWRPTRSGAVEVQNDIDDVGQMIAAQNRLRERRGKTMRTHEQVQEQVRHHQRELSDFADAYWRDQRSADPAADVAITIYEKAACSNCRRLARLLTERGIDFDRVDYHIDPLPAGRIAELLAKAGVSPRDALRVKEPAARALYDRRAPDAEILAAMEADPVLLQRPIVERGDRAVLARPAERVLELL